MLPPFLSPQSLSTVAGPILCLLLVLLLSPFPCGPAQLRAQRSADRTVTVSNTTPRLTADGHIVDAHDGRVIRFGDRYYWYGTAYGNTNGFQTANHYVCYSSPDLVTWTMEGRLLPDQPEGVYYRPHVIYNAANEEYVLWYNWYPQLWDGQFGVAVSKTPTGPFEIVNDDVAMFRSDEGLGDFGLFVDKDATAYISYNTINNHRVSIERLSDDYRSSTLENGGVIAEHVEAGSQFRRNGKYYLLTDYTCCFCNYGSGARVYISDDPLSGYALTGNINRLPGPPQPVLTDGRTVGTHYATLRRHEGEFPALELRPAGSDLSGTTLSVHQFTGNRKENCGQVDNPRVHPEIGLPAFSLDAWQYDRWVPIPLGPAALTKTALSQVHHLALPDTLTAHRLRLRIDSSYRYDAVYLNEVSIGSDNGQRESPGAAAPLRETLRMTVYLTAPTLPRPPIIPAQQTYVMQLPGPDGPTFHWMGDLWGSASDNRKGHDYQYWSGPLRFRGDGTIAPLEWEGEWAYGK